MNKKHIIKLSVVAALVVAIAGTITYSMHNATAKLVNLGYEETKAKELVNISNMYHIADNEKDRLNKLVADRKADTKELGIEPTKVQALNLSNTALYDDYNKIDSLCDETEKDLQSKLTNLEKLAKDYKIDYKYKDNTLYGKYTYLNKLINKNQDALIDKYEDNLSDLGFSNAKIEKLSSKNKAKTIAALKTAYTKEKKRMKALDGFQSAELKEQAMRMFKMTNEYRKSKGLKPYTYNSAQQACVHTEAKAYASNNKPHNWLCKAAANENAGLSSVNSDYVKVAMDFFISDPPHEAVLSGNYSSVAISIVNKGNMNYMIMDVFN